MADYFTEYPTFIKALPSPADTPYETPDFIRSKRSSRIAASREHSNSPPLPADTAESHERSRDGRYSGVDPRRFTPTLHASLVSEILNLRRELDSKNNLVENLETSLSSARAETETLEAQLTESNKDARKAKHQVQQMEKGVYDAVEDLVTERDATTAALEDLKHKFETVQKRARQQDEDAVRNQGIWEAEKDAWDNERRQLERRIHITETRLRVVIDEVAANHTHAPPSAEHNDESTFKDSGLGEGSDTASISSASPTKHRRNLSSISFAAKIPRSSMTPGRSAATPDLYAQQGNSLADELGIDEEDGYDMEDFEDADEGLDGSMPNKVPSTDVRSDSMTTEPRNGASKFEATSSEAANSAETVTSMPGKFQNQDLATTSLPTSLTPETAPKVVYVDTGYQPSPPPSPKKTKHTEQASSRTEVGAVKDDLSALETKTAPTSPTQSTESIRHDGSSPMSPPQTPVVKGVAWPEINAPTEVARTYSTASTQTDLAAPEKVKGHGANRDSLSPPMFVPAIAIHPPTSRPSSPRPHVLPPGTRSASTQASLGWPCKDVSVQTEEIRVDKRLAKLPSHLLPNNLLPSPAIQEPIRSRRDMPDGLTQISTTFPLAGSDNTPSMAVSLPLQSPTDSSPGMSRNNSSKDLKSYQLKALPLPRPVLSPISSPVETSQSNGPLNRSPQYGVTQPATGNASLVEGDQSSEASDRENEANDNEYDDLADSAPAVIRPPPGRFGLSEPPKAVPEEKESSPVRRPATSDSWNAAPASSLASSHATSQKRHLRQITSKTNAPDIRRELHSRSPSLGSHASSSRSVQSSSLPMPPYPIPLRSSSRVPNQTLSEGSQSPTPRDGFTNRHSRGSRSQLDRQTNLRKVQSAVAIRHRTGRGSPSKHRRRRRSPDLTPVQSMAFESPAPTDFPMPDLPTPLQDHRRFDWVKGSVDLRASTDGPDEPPRVSEETNLVDAIAATMVGEWMWKYIRKRKSFGIGEDSAEVSVADKKGVVNNVTAHGTRHKRWVWLSPYERTIMWDNKQPTSGSALLGKKGRKLSIQSVISVYDPTPLPKSPELASAWSQSILILTPERALKFTTINEERHQLWLTALCFLAQSDQLPRQIPQKLRAPEIPPTPPMPSLPSMIDGVPIRRQRSPSFGKIRVRDSIRLAHGKRPDSLKAHSQKPGPYVPDTSFDYAGPEDSADFPAVPRLYVSTNKHQRKRSNTSPRIPSTLTLNNLRSFSSSAAHSSASTSSAQQQAGSTNASTYRPSASSKSGSARESVASPDRLNFFEAFGTVRMEAFVDPNVKDGVLYVPGLPQPGNSAAGRRPRHGRNLSQTTVDKRRAGYVFDDDGLDPFKGFSGVH